MNRRRLTGLCLIAALLLIPAVVHADVGNSFSGGSGYSGGGYSGGGYSGGSGLGGMFFFMGGGGGSILGAIIMILIIVAWAYFSKNTQNSRRQDTPYQGGVSHRICNETAAVSALREIDPQFSVEGFKSFASEVYLTLQEAWEAKEWRKVRPFESNSLFNMHSHQIQEYIDSGKTNHLNMQNVRSITIADFHVDGAREVLSVKLEASLLDYTTDDESGEVLEGSKTQYQHRFYYLEFIRSAGVKTAAEKDLQITNCPNCGAPTQVTSSGECEYCHSVITNGDFGWVLNQYMAW